MSSTAQRVIADLQELEEDELNRISRKVEDIKESRNERLEEDLDGVARMALRDTSTQKLRPFVISYFKGGKVSTAQGVELGTSNLVKEEDEGKETRVYVFSGDYPVGGTFYTMKRFEKALKESNIPYALIYSEDVE